MREVKGLESPVPNHLQDIQRATRLHRRDHGCGAYTFEDGEGLVRLVKGHNAQRILELGTALGFTACCLAQGSETAKVDTIEADITHVHLARKHILQAGLATRISVHHGYFSDVLPNLKPDYDAVFFDGFGPSGDLISQLGDLLKSGGLLICANIALADSPQRQLIEKYINDVDLWIQKDPIENGRTVVRIKR